MVLVAVVSVGAWLVVYAGSGGAATVDTAAAPSTITAAVHANGAPVGPAAQWQAARSGLGRYELEFRRPVHLVVDTWAETATVVLRPVTERRWLVEFIDGHHAVDTAFSFTAAPLP